MHAPTDIERRLRGALPAGVDHASARLVAETVEYLAVRRDVVQPSVVEHDLGVMFTVCDGGAAGYGATSDLSDAGLAEAVERARRWTRAASGRGVLADPPYRHPVGGYESIVERPWTDVGLADRIDLLMRQSRRLGGPERVVDWSVGLAVGDVESLLITSGGGRVDQTLHQVLPEMQVTANDGASNTQTRSYGAGALSGQGGVEVLDRHGFGQVAPRLTEEALALLDAPNCPSGTMDVVLAPDQMVLQIHESIGHPLELDRILGDERNYAGSSFVTPDMFGTYRYGSELLNVTFDPTVAGQLASYAFDDDGTPAERVHLIREGLLLNPLGGTLSQARARLAGVASSRACSWNRPPIDRMANLNLEPGPSPLAELVASVEDGVLMETNVSWSIDDHRNKFQFGCEIGRLISDGEITGVVRNPNYRGISAEFWRSLTGVADADSFTVMGVPNCGKGEPNQMIRVGHASPHCRFSDVDVFGGDR
ncbi:MAG: TldD/PmbA family protein [Acidimicrobiales bacterium]